MTRKQETSKSPENSRREVLGSVGRDSPNANLSSSRRNVLRGTAAAALATVGLTGTAAAIDPTGEYAAKHAKQPFTSEGVAREAFEAEGAELFEVLAERGYIEESSANELGDVRVKGLVYGDDATARLETTDSYRDGELIVSVEPQLGRAYAVDSSGSETTILDPSVEGDEVDTSSCAEGSNCITDDYCSSGCQLKEVYCCTDGSCYLGTNLDCCDDDSCPSGCSEVCS